MSNKIWRYSAGKRGESPEISGAAGPVTAIIDFTRIVGDEGRVLRAVRAGLIVAGGSAGSILGGPSNRSRTLVGGLSLVKKDRALELGWVEIKPRPRDSCQEESPSAEHQLRSNGPGDQRPAACIENVENQCSPKNRCQGEREPEVPSTKDVIAGSTVSRQGGGGEWRENGGQWHENSGQWHENSGQ